jgi:hypothetical protein
MIVDWEEIRGRGLSWILVREGWEININKDM